jgi:hypothetical protein
MDYVFQLPNEAMSTEIPSVHVEETHPLSLDPKAFFHIFLSYRVASEASWVSKLYQTLHSRSSVRDKGGAGIPSAKETKFPQTFMPQFPGTGNEANFVNIFWDKEVLTNAQLWRGDGTRNGGGFVSAILQSVVFVPVMSCNSLEKLLHQSTDIDNVLLELLLAKFLFQEKSTKQKEVKALDPSASLWPCSMIFPIMSKGVKELAATLSPKIFKTTNEEAFRLLTRAGYCPPRDMIDDQNSAAEFVHPWSVRSIVSFYSDFHDKDGVELVDDSSNALLKDNFICDMILDCVTLAMKPRTPLNPRESMLHVFLCSDFGTKDDIAWVSDLNSSIQCFALEQYILGNGIPFAKECSFPENIQNSGHMAEHALNVCSRPVSAAVEGADKGFGERNTSYFIGPAAKSLVFVPILSCDIGTDEQYVGSVERLSKLKDDYKEVEKSSPLSKFLMDLLFAKYLFEQQQLNQTDIKGSASLWPCSLIYPIMGRKAYNMLEKLSSRIYRPTNEEAFRLLTRAGYCPPRDMIDDQNSATEFVHPWSVRSIVSFFFRFQGKITSGGSKQYEEIAFCSTKIFNVAHWSVSSCKELQVQLERTNPLASELQDFLNESFLRHISPLLIKNGIKSIRRLSQLDSHSMQSLSIQIANQFQTSDIDELFKLRDAVSAAQLRQESHSLNDRLNEFVDENASWATALYSTCAVDILLRKMFYLFVMIVGSLLLFTVGMYLILLPTVYTRKFPGSDAPQTYTHRYTSTAVLCFVGAVSLGPISIGCTYLSSPRKGRYALAYLFYLTLFFVQLAAFIADDANSVICQYLSLETTPQSVQNCIIVYAVSFVVRELYFFAIFLTVLFRQEYYWIGFDLGLCVVLSCNIFIYFYSQSSINNVAITIVVIIILLILLMKSLHSRRQNIIDTKKKCDESNDAKYYLKAFSDYQDKHGAKSDSALQNVFNNQATNHYAFLNNSDLQNLEWIEAAPNSKSSILRCNQLLQFLPIFKTVSQQSTSPVEGPNDHIVVRQHENDFERLFFLAESVNTPFHQLIQSICGSNAPNTFVDSECKHFLKPDVWFFAKVILGPIKSTQRAIEKVQRLRASIQH